MWWKEVVLTWVNLSAWWLRDTNDVWQSRFAELLEYILEKTTIPRLRISSLWPEFIDDRCLEIFKNKRIYPHFHFSVQSGSSKVLKDMRRHYDWEYMRKLLEKTKNLEREDWVEVSIWADWKYENQVSDLEKKDRMWDLEFIADSVRDDFIERNIWKKFEVLIEVVKEENWKIRWKGWTENYIEADDRTFEILEWEIKKNSIVKWILK